MRRTDHLGCRANLLLSHATVSLLVAGVMMITAVVLTHRAGQPGTRGRSSPRSPRGFSGDETDLACLPPLPSRTHRRVLTQPGARSRQRRRPSAIHSGHTGDQRADAGLHLVRVPVRARIPEAAAVRHGGVADPRCAAGLSAAIVTFPLGPPGPCHCSRPGN
jgi:hypothetical protein